MAVFHPGLTIIVHPEQTDKVPLSPSKSHHSSCSLLCPERNKMTSAHFRQRQVRFAVVQVLYNLQKVIRANITCSEYYCESLTKAS